MVRPRANSLRNAVLAAGLVVSSFGCAEPPGEPDVQERLQLAQTRYDAALAAGHAWRAHRLALQSAREALTQGDSTAAHAHIDEAQLLADASLAQAKREAVEWQTRFPFRAD